MDEFERNNCKQHKNLFCRVVKEVQAYSRPRMIKLSFVSVDCFQFMNTHTVRMWILQIRCCQGMWVNLTNSITKATAVHTTGWIHNSKKITTYTTKPYLYMPALNIRRVQLRFSFTFSSLQNLSLKSLEFFSDMDIIIFLAWKLI